VTLRRLLPTLLLPLLLGPLAACGGEDEPAKAEDSGAGFNEADVEFATAMIPHHAQALVMVDLTMGRKVDPELARLAEQIRTAQAPEIEQMADWLTDWDEPVPETMRDHANAHGDAHMAESDMPGMLSAEDLDELESLSGTEFQVEWVASMIEHHEGAVEMAEQELEEGTFPGALHLAEHIADAQSDEIETLERLEEKLGS
jgi:uncharacterized protein (DUF305 family)